MSKTPHSSECDARPVISSECFARSVALAWFLAALTILVLGAIAAGKSHHPSHTVIGTYLGAGRSWLTGRALYEGSAGFVYSPLVAAFFSPFTWLPPEWSHPLWLAVSMGGFLWATGWALRDGFFPAVRREQFASVFLLLLPLSIGNFNNGQVNPLVIGLLLVAILAVKKRWMMLAAFAVAAAVYFKIYPIAMGLVLVVAYPKDFSWRFFLALAVLGALSFVLQRPSYVAAQYQLWFATRAADHRHEEGIVRDVFMIFKALHLGLSERAHAVCQVLSGGAIAVLAFLGRFRFGWRDERLLPAIFCLVDAWMLLCGPATESATYVMLAPAVAFAVVQSFRQPLPGGMKGLALSSFAVLVLGTAINSFLHLQKTPFLMSIQPFGALLFATFAAIWISCDRFWSGSAGEHPNFAADAADGEH